MEINNREELKSLYKKKRGTPRINNYQSCSCNNGHLHHSRSEAQYCNQLYFEKESGGITEIKTQVHYDLYVNGKKICGIRPDFLVTYKDGTEEIIEFKGFRVELWVQKWRLFEALYPDLKKKIVTKADLW